MKTFEKPKILVSKCIEHDYCRYDGSMITSHFVKRIKKFVNIETICPEVIIGMTIPREAVRIIYQNEEKRLVSSMGGIDYTTEMQTFSENFSKALKEKKMHGAILKSRSPSCGIKAVKVYKTTGKVPCLEMKSAGFFGGEVMHNNPNLPVEDEGRLLNYDIREHFLTRIFTLANFDKVKESQKMSELVKFQSEYKYLLMAYHQKEQKLLGQIVANPNKLPLSDVLIRYEAHLKKALLQPLKKGSNTNMILHMFGYVSGGLNDLEKAFFLDQLTLYNKNKKPFSAIMNMIYSWVIRFEVQYLINQMIFEPYPIEILDVMDSGKGIK